MGSYAADGPGEGAYAVCILTVWRPDPMSATMKNIGSYLVAGTIALCGCSPTPKPDPNTEVQPESRHASKAVATAFVDVANSAEQEAVIRALVDQLVIAEGQASNRPMRTPSMKIYNADGKEVKPTGDTKAAEEYRKTFESCQMAFQKLFESRIAAFPVLIEHLDDKRQSINFRNHFLGNSVGDACRWNIYFQLQDMPKNYSEYGHSRTGRDGKRHPKPYWEGTPFDDAGGVKNWLEQNRNLTYPEMQIKCLQWLLAKEKTIGACDAESYFLNILPLEIRILERKQEAGENVAEVLDRLRKVLKNKEVKAIPVELLPAR